MSSVLAQVYSNLEIILIDDGSTDESGKLCDEFALSDERISVFHKTNGGLSRARNYGVEHCHGDWILFVDSDDYVSPVYVEALWTAVESRHCNMAAFAFSLPFQDGDVADLAQRTAVCIGVKNSYLIHFRIWCSRMLPLCIALRTMRKQSH